MKIFFTPKSTHHPINKKPYERSNLNYSIFDNHNELECEACLIYTIKIKSNNLSINKTGKYD